MTWIKRKIDEHKCLTPPMDPDVSYGDVWECDHCKTQWIVNEDQRDGKWYELNEA